jgi:GT2 family glycosyltransferase
MTCHNRVDKTLKCLESLFHPSNAKDVDLDVVLVDAGSTDGTREAVERGFPEVRVIAVSSDLFWNGGMRVAIANAVERNPDFYLWLNDDVVLDKGSIGTLVDCARVLGRVRSAPLIVAGTTRDPASGAPTYGGVARSSAWQPMRYELVGPTDQPRPAETMNGNCVLVARPVVMRIGNLATAFTHGMGDFDYGNRARRAGCEVWVAPGTIGTCARNPRPPRAASLREYRQRMTSATGGLPPGEWFTFARRWGGPVWPVFAVSPYVKRFARWITRR